MVFWTGVWVNDESTGIAFIFLSNLAYDMTKMFVVGLVKKKFLPRSKNCPLLVPLPPGS